MQKVHTRLDIASKATYPKEEMIRFVISSSKGIELDESGGRGYYLHKEKGILEAPSTKKAFIRLLHRELNEAEIKLLTEAIDA